MVSLYLLFLLALRMNAQRTAQKGTKPLLHKCISKFYFASILWARILNRVINGVKIVVPCLFPTQPTDEVVTSDLLVTSVKCVCQGRSSVLWPLWLTTGWIPSIFMTAATKSCHNSAAREKVLLKSDIWWGAFGTRGLMYFVAIIYGNYYCIYCCPQDAVTIPASFVTKNCNLKSPT